MRRLPSLVKGVGFRSLFLQHSVAKGKSRRSSRVRISPSAPFSVMLIICFCHRILVNIMKYLFLATDENKMQLYHLLLNAINYHKHGHKVAAVLECASPKLLIGIADGSIKIPVFDKAMELGIIDHACKTCTAMFSATEAAQKLCVPLKGDLSGHSDLLRFSQDGYTILTF